MIQISEDAWCGSVKVWPCGKKRAMLPLGTPTVSIGFASNPTTSKGKSDGMVQYGFEPLTGLAAFHSPDQPGTVFNRNSVWKVLCLGQDYV